MKNLIVGSLIALAASQAAGCIITSGDDTVTTPTSPPPGSSKNVSTNTQTACPPGFDTVALFNQAVDSSDDRSAPAEEPNNNGTTCFVDLFDCADGAGLSFPLPPTRSRRGSRSWTTRPPTLYAASIPALRRHHQRRPELRRADPQRRWLLLVRLGAQRRRVEPTLTCAAAPVASSRSRPTCRPRATRRATSSTASRARATPRASSRRRTPCRSRRSTRRIRRSAPRRR